VSSSKVDTESSETSRQTPRSGRERISEDKVRTAWRHAEGGRNDPPPIPGLLTVGLAKSSNNVSEIPCRVSSDLHEWSNDLGTVSTRGSANL
jgi:hypothetical protein